MQLNQSGTGINYWENPGAFYIDAMVNTVFTEKERETYWQVAGRYDQCFQLAKQGKLTEAQLVYESCCTISKEVRPQLLNWVLAFYGQRLCYYHYKMKDYNEGVALTMTIVESVKRLRQNGYHYLFFVDIQQQLNLARIYFELNETALAISLCANSIISMYKQAGTLNSNNMINEVPESRLIEVTQYGMLIEVLAETCNRTFFKLKEDTDSLESAMMSFVKPLLQLNFSVLSVDSRYACIDKFISLVSGLCGYNELKDDDILFFMTSPNVDRKLLRVLNNYITLVNA